MFPHSLPLSDMSDALRLGMQGQEFSARILLVAGDDAKLEHAAGALAMGMATAVFLELTTGQVAKLLISLALEIDDSAAEDKAQWITSLMGTVGDGAAPVGSWSPHLRGLAAEYDDRLALLVGSHGEAKNRDAAARFAAQCSSMACEATSPEFGHVAGALAAGMCLAQALGVSARTLAEQLPGWTRAFYPEPVTNRYRLARERAGLTLAQAAAMLGWDLVEVRRLDAMRAIEAADDVLVEPSVHKKMARLYGVSYCWLSGHHPKPDLTALAQRAEELALPNDDWAKVVELVQSRATCARCWNSPATNRERAHTCYRCGEVGTLVELERAVGVWWCRDCIARAQPACLRCGRHYSSARERSTELVNTCRPCADVVLRPQEEALE